MSEFVDYLHEVFEPFGPIRSRKMFGAHGIYHHDLMFALVMNEELYLKADSESIPMFEEHDLGPFEYPKKDGSVTVMSYYLAPEIIYDDPDEAMLWASLAFDAAVRASNAKRAKKPKKKTS